MATFDNVDTFAELQAAINDSKGNGQADVINITGDITLDSLLPLIEEDTSLTINGGGFTISGDVDSNGNDNGDVRLFFVRSGTVTFDNLNFDGGRAEGESGGGGGAGMGGALFVYGGDVTVNNSN